MSEFSSKSEYDKTHFSVNIAGLQAEIHSVYPASYYFCRQYLSSGSPLFTIEVSQEEIQQEIEETGQYFYTCTGHIGGKNDNRIEKSINESKIELAVVYRKFIEKALDYDTVFMHGAVIAVRDRAFMFTAPSGTGKTTHIMKWLQNMEDAFVVNGDKPLVRITDNKVTAYGTPWCGKENLGTNTSAPLKAIILMERSGENHIEEISFSRAYPSLLQQTYLPHDPEKGKKTLSLLAKLGSQVRFYRFKFNNYADDCFDVAYHGILGTKE